MASGSSGGGKQKTDNAPWKPLQPYLLDLYGQAKSQVLNNPREYYSGQTVANFSPDTLNAFNLIRARAGEGTPLMDAAAGYAKDVMGGKYLSQDNPYLAAVQQRLGDSIASQAADRFAGAGRTLGSPGEVQVFQRELANASAPYLYGNYQQERAAMADAAKMLPGIESTSQALDYQNLAALQGIGSAYDTKAQQRIDSDMARWNFNQSEPYQRLSQYAQLLGASTPFTSSTSQSMVPGQGVGGMIGGGIAGAGSGAMTGAMLGSLVPGLGTGLGAALGGGMGLLGGIFSDPRLKRDVRAIGRHANGLPIYLFRYVWDDELRMGHMSDDVRKVAPWAVREIGGYDVVDYRRLGWW